MVRINDSACAAPGVLYVARNEHRLTSAEVEALPGGLQLHFPLNDVNPFILVLINVTGPSCIVYFQYTHCAARVLSRHLAVNPRAVVCKPFVEAILFRSNAEACEQFLTLHFPGSFQVLYGF